MLGPWKLLAGPKLIGSKKIQFPDGCISLLPLENPFVSRTSEHEEADNYRA